MRHSFKIISILVITLILSMSGAIYSQEYSPGVQAYRNMQYKTAKPLLQQEIESLKSSLKEDTLATLYEYLQLSYTFTRKPDSSIYYLNEGTKFARENGLMNMYARLEINKAENTYMQNKMNESLFIYQRLLDSFDISYDYKIDALSRIATISVILSDSLKAQNNIKQAIELIDTSNYQDMVNVYAIYGEVEQAFGSITQAVEYYIKALDYAHKIDNKFKVNDCLRNLTNVFYTIQDYEKASSYATEYLNHSKEIKLKRGIALAHKYLGMIAVDQRRTEEAIDRFELSIGVFKKLRIYRQTLILHLELAKLYYEIEEFAKSEEQIKEATAFYDRLESSKFKAIFHIIKSRLATKKNKLSEAWADITRADKLLVPVPNQEEHKALLLAKTEFYYKKQDFEKAFDYYRLYTLKKDSLFGIEQSEIVYDLEAKYQKAEQDKTISSLNAENKINEIQLSRQRLMLWGSLATLALISIFLFSIYRLYRKVNVQNGIISQALKDKDTLLREIHHRVKNNLQVISSLLALQSKYVADDNALDALKEGQDRVQSMALIHQDLYQTDNLKGVDTKQYIEQLAENLIESYEIHEDRIQLNTDIEAIMLDVDTMIPLGLMINELVSNALKHGLKDRDQGKIDIQLKEVDNILYLNVSDDGIGIPNKESIDGKSFGFELIKAFAKKLKAEIEIQSEEGLSITIRISNYKIAA